MQKEEMTYFKNGNIATLTRTLNGAEHHDTLPAFVRFHENGLPDIEIWKQHGDILRLDGGCPFTGYRDDGSVRVEYWITPKAQWNGGPSWTVLPRNEKGETDFEGRTILVNGVCEKKSSDRYMMAK